MSVPQPSGEDGNSIALLCKKHNEPKVQHFSGKRANGSPKINWVCRKCVSDRGRKGQHKKREWDQRNKQKRRAHKIVETALLSGKIIRESCARCGDRDSQAHHEDYSRPLDLVWLCPKHHKERHRELDAAKAAVYTQEAASIKPAASSSVLRD